LKIGYIGYIHRKRNSGKEGYRQTYEAASLNGRAAKNFGNMLLWKLDKKKDQ